ncbi:Swarming motility regulation protein RssB [Phytobacter ursingii]|uniref:DNA-binding response regulator n=1 Tax=Kluyvera intermedia TaxID=61648 RepID=A0ABX3UB51_KLUIN|nr:response regulator transcription factor [Kluyvera intermedia]MCL9671288.1 response regulator transcription factor [Citrobacter sp. MNAZ 1397]VTP14299.1 Swarming motility regulation protein RssB [Phytobacter ursingii]ORJ48531.1 DNA-binding response regulator [Kluyvera intermedia]HAT2607311.1 response regulator transcription factor [Kluyvera intermedia]HAT2612524.1 response regulator transcription factor [Kluyvera intermedia]
MKILLIEDDLDLGNGVRIALADQGFDVIWVRRKEDALHQIDACVPELVLLDLGLPDGDGMSLMAYMRQQLKGIPVIILTARGTLQDRLSGLDAGADDYLVKPFVLAELLARVRALARRSYGFRDEVIDIRGLTLHVPTRRVTVSARNIELTASEYALLEILMLRTDRVLTRRFLEERVFGSKENMSNALDVHMGNLRRKIGEGYVRTVRGVGYVIDTVPIQKGDG